MIYLSKTYSPRTLTLTILLNASCSFLVNINAKTFDLPAHGDVVGSVFTVSSDQLKPDDNFLTISERYGVGFHELEEANPGYNPWSPGYGDLVIPHRYVLPKNRNGIVINLAELRLYYFPKNSGKVITYPVGIGKKDWSTPVVSTKVVGKVKNPTWTVPDSIKEEYKNRGEKIADYIPAGKDNPLGKYAIRLAEPGYLLHGSNVEVGVGLRVSHGCIRLFNPDIENLFNIVPDGTPVQIINQPYKIGSDGNKIYMEAHKPLSEDASDFKYDRGYISELLDKMNVAYKVNWNATEYAAEELRGIPVPIGIVR